MNRRPGRNDPCSCGSGRKYKNCCEGKSRMFGQKIPGVAIWIVVGVVGVGVAAYAMLRPERPGFEESAAVPPEQRPAPYTYDSLRNQHFDPVHGHWHDGRPPASAGAQASGTATTVPGATTTAPGSAPAPAPAPTANAPYPTNPEPWTYDTEKNQHWDPAHQHWHPGPPPPGK